MRTRLLTPPILLLFELEYDLMLLLFKLPHQLVEALCDIVQLLLEEPRQLLLDLLDHLCIVLNQPFGVVYHLPQVYHVLLHRVSYNEVNNMQGTYPFPLLA